MVSLLLLTALLAAPASASPAKAGCKASSAVGEARGCEAAFDDDDKTFWAAGSPGPGAAEWAEQTFAEPMEIAAFELKPGAGEGCDKLAKVLVQTGDVRREVELPAELPADATVLLVLRERTSARSVKLQLLATADGAVPAHGCVARFTALPMPKSPFEEPRGTLLAFLRAEKPAEFLPSKTPAEWTRATRASVAAEAKAEKALYVTREKADKSAKFLKFASELRDELRIERPLVLTRVAETDEHGPQLVVTLPPQMTGHGLQALELVLENEGKDGWRIETVSAEVGVEPF